MAYDAAQYQPASRRSERQVVKSTTVPTDATVSKGSISSATKPTTVRKRKRLPEHVGTVPSKRQKSASALSKVGRDRTPPAEVANVSLASPMMGTAGFDQPNGIEESPQSIITRSETLHDSPDTDVTFGRPEVLYNELRGVNDHIEPANSISGPTLPAQARSTSNISSEQNLTTLGSAPSEAAFNGCGDTSKEYPPNVPVDNGISSPLSSVPSSPTLNAIAANHSFLPAATRFENGHNCAPDQTHTKAELQTRPAGMKGHNATEALGPAVDPPATLTDGDDAEMHSMDANGTTVVVDRCLQSTSDTMSPAIVDSALTGFVSAATTPVVQHATLPLSNNTGPALEDTSRERRRSSRAKAVPDRLGNLVAVTAVEGLDEGSSSDRAMEPNVEDDNDFRSDGKELQAKCKRKKPDSKEVKSSRAKRQAATANSRGTKREAKASVKNVSSNAGTKSRKTSSSIPLKPSSKTQGTTPKSKGVKRRLPEIGDTIAISSGNITIRIPTNSSTSPITDEDEVVVGASRKTPKKAGTKAASSLPSPPSSQEKPSVSLKRSQTARGPASPSMLVKLPTLPPLPKIEPEKLQLSQRLTERYPLKAKPLPQGQPEVWAESRQALCETLSYFKKPQGGCYQNDGHVYGFLFDSVGHCREYMDENVIICRAGGSMESDPSGGMVQRKDQSMKEAQVQAVLNDIAHHNPVIVICGNRNLCAPCEMPHQYSVLGWYKPVMVWSEKTAGKGSKVWTTIKYRLERLNRDETAWHAPSDSKLSREAELLDRQATIAACMFCRTESPQIYLEGWMCLDQGCRDFWKLDRKDAPFGKEGLHYDPDFLLHMSEPWKTAGDKREPEPAELRPPVPNVGQIIGDNLAYVNTRGICCPECGRCNSRRLFKGWKCENPKCDFELFPQHRPVKPAMLHTPWDAAPTLVRNKHAPSVNLLVQHRFGYKISIYTFDGIDGRFIHAAASKEIVQEERGANDMFEAIQQEDMGLERRVFAGQKMSGGKDGKDSQEVLQIPTPPRTPPEASQESQATQLDGKRQAKDAEDPTASKQEFEDGDLMTAFSMNYGMPYKFVASGGSKSFEAAPWPVRECRRRLNWAQRHLLDKEDHKDFNEELIFAYLEGQKIEYHDDGEQGLGPCIATASFGGRAKMHMRMKMKHFVGCSKTGVFTEEKPVPGSIDGDQMYKSRLEEWRKLQDIKCDTAAYNKRRKEIPKELGIFDKRNKKADDLVTVTLSHGDIVVMDGYDIQKYLEHKVVPEGYLRFALTCRTVLPDHLKDDERPSYTVEVDPDTYNGPSV